jgi:hypothetical protein
MVRFISSMSNLPLLTIGDNYYSRDKMIEWKMVTGQGYGMSIGGYNRLCPAATGHTLVTLFFLSLSIEDRHLPWMIVRSQIYYPEHILMRTERLVTLLSWVSALSRPIDWRRRKVEV